MDRDGISWRLGVPWLRRTELAERAYCIISIEHCGLPRLRSVLISSSLFTILLILTVLMDGIHPDSVPFSSSTSSNTAFRTTWNKNSVHLTPLPPRSHTGTAIALGISRSRGGGWATDGACWWYHRPQETSKAVIISPGLEHLLNLWYTSSNNIEIIPFAIFRLPCYCSFVITH
jgi:hypothetical protein